MKDLPKQKQKQKQTDCYLRNRNRIPKQKQHNHEDTKTPWPWPSYPLDGGGDRPKPHFIQRGPVLMLEKNHISHVA